MSDSISRLNAALEGRYRIERELGQGGMSTVYLAEDLKRPRKVAIKVLEPDMAQAVGPHRFLREIDVAAGLSHPHILPVFDSGDADGLLFYVTPYVRGESLRERLKRERQLPLEDALRLATEVADALAYAHEQGVVHRDVKPGNILLEAGHAVLADFGIARATAAVGGERLTRTGLAVGTPAYMSPEQASGEDIVDGRSDVYSLGCVLFEMLSGDPPFYASTPQAMLARKLADPVPSVRAVRDAVPASLERTLMRALARVPADRFADARAFAQALRQPAAEEPLDAHGGARARGWAAALTVVVAAAGLGGWWALTRDATPSGIAGIAVLPLVDLVQDPERAFLVQGMHDELIGELSRIGALKVISRQSTLRYAESTMTVPEIAAELDVDALVSATVLTVGDTVRLRAQLVSAFPEERQLWSGTFESDLANLLSVYRGIVSEVAREIRLAVTEEEAARLASAPTVSPQAYEAYLRGRVNLSRATRESFEAAVSEFHRAVDADSTYARAYAALALALIAQGNFKYLPPTEVFPRARDYALRSLALDSTLVDTQVAIAAVAGSFERNWGEAGEGWRRAVALDPNDAEARSGLAFWLIAMGRYEEAIEEHARAVSLDPHSLRMNTNLARMYHFARRYDEAIEHFSRALAMGPNYAGSHVLAGLTHVMAGRAEEGLRLLERGDELAGLDYPVPLLGTAYAALGRDADAREVVARLEARPDWMRERPAGTALAYLAVGDTDRAFAWLDVAVEEYDSWLFQLNDPVFDPLRDDPRFAALLNRLGLERAGA